jgi:cyclopropane fatty-acyl-phospholipid synthase-like methyltransferase
MRDMREIVKKGYEEGDYYKFYRLGEGIDDYPMEKSNVDRLTGRLEEGARILDLGCGSGIPFDKYLADQGFQVTGVDFVQKHIDLARELVPNATFIEEDFTEVDFSAESFDAVLSLYAIFHIPRREHRDLLLSIRRLLRDDGLMLVTMGTITEDETDVGDFIGSEMAWSSYTIEENLRLVEDCGFEIVHWEEEGEAGILEHHLWILARKK